MSGRLTDRQTDDLQRSLLFYLHSANLTRTYESLLSESPLLDSSDFSLEDPTNSKYNGLLEKKWTSVIRLQKKIMDLEARNAALQTELSTASRGSGGSSSLTSGSGSGSSTGAGNALWLPRVPQRHTLLGHRSPVSRVAFHPIFSQLASASEDSTIKVWDWESGECEKTLKGHTKAVMDLDYDAKGELLGQSGFFFLLLLLLFSFEH